jgi:hypothetical protein
MTQDVGEKILLGAGIAGFGYLAWKGLEKRRTFPDRLAQELASMNVRLIYPDLGFLADGRHAWNLTVEVPGWGAETLFAPIERGADPYEDTTIQDLVRRVGAWLRVQAA